MCDVKREGIMFAKRPLPRERRLMDMPNTFFPAVFFFPPLFFFIISLGCYQNVIKDLCKCHNVHTQLPVCLTRLSKHEVDLDDIIRARCLEHKVPRESVAKPGVLLSPLSHYRGNSLARQVDELSAVLSRAADGS